MTMKMRNVEIELVETSEYLTRAMEDDESYEELKKSISSMGILQPVLVKRVDQIYKVVAGHRRVMAARAVGLKQVPVAIMVDSGNKAWAATMAENIFRKNLSPVEQAAALNDLYKSKTYTIEELARIMHKSQTWVEQQINICSWPRDILKAVHEAKISVSAARNLAKIDNEATRKQLLEYAIDNGVTARITAAWYQAYETGMKTAEIESIDKVGTETPASHIEPHAPCIVCGDMYKMIQLTYLPICQKCNDQIIGAIRKKSAAVNDAT